MSERLLTPHEAALVATTDSTVGGSDDVGAAVEIVEALGTMAAFMRVGTGGPDASVADDPVDDTSHADRQSAFLRRNLDALATRLGQIQARLARLDSLGERVAAMAGFDSAARTVASDAPAGGSKTVSVKSVATGATAASPASAAAARGGPLLPDAGGARPAGNAPLAPARGLDAPGQGGPLLPDRGALTIDELDEAIADVARSLDRRSEQLALLESEFLFMKAAKRLVPSVKPVSVGYTASRFGRRDDPFTGRRSRHEGLDFAAPRGTPIHAAGPGVVTFAARHSAYGNQVDIDHGGGLVTRYAHAHRLFVKVGDIVRQGQKVAEVGSTGRSTGPHLHFEVRIDDVAHDPMKFLGNPLAFDRHVATRTAAR